MWRSSSIASMKRVAGGIRRLPQVSVEEGIVSPVRGSVTKVTRHMFLMTASGL